MTVSLVKVQDKWAATVKCPNDVVGLVVGREQHHVKQILTPFEGKVFIEISKRTQVARPVSGVHLKFCDWVDQVKSCTLNVSGQDKEAVEEVTNQIKTAIQKAMAKSQYTHTLAIPIDEARNSQFIEAIQKYKTKCINGGVDPKACVNTAQLQLGLVMLKIYDEETMEKVDQTVTEVLREMKIGPLKLNFHGAHIFESDKPDRCHLIYTHAGEHAVESDARSVSLGLLKRTSSNLLDAHKCLKSVMRQLEGQSADGCKDEIQSLLNKIPSTLATLDSLTKIALPYKKDKSGSRPASSGADVSTVTGPEVGKIFSLFDRLIQRLVDIGCLHDIDLLERRIVRDAEGHCTKSSLSLHVPLVCPKWANVSSSPSDRRNGSTFNATELLDSNADFGSVVVDRVSLVRRNDRFFADREYVL